MTAPADPPINWRPLERFCDLAAARGVTGLDADDFMWMGGRVSPAGVPIQLYKHIDTRRYLNLDASGHAYHWRSRDDSYQLTSITAAIERLSVPGSSVAATIIVGWSACTAPPTVPGVPGSAEPGLAG